MSRNALGLMAAVAVAGCAGVIVVGVSQGLDRAVAWAGLLGGLATIMALVVAVWAMPRKPVVPLPPQEEVPDGTVSRPAELAKVVQAVVGGQTGTVGITTGLIGAGGFGKTTLAKMVCADRQVQQEFKGRVYWFAVGQDVRDAARITAKVNEVIQSIFGKQDSFPNPQSAGAMLGALLNPKPRRLLVLDDIWTKEQLAPFTKGGRRCTRLVTTRMPELLEGQGTAVQVDQMSPEQARELLTSGLPPLDPPVVNGLLKVTGQWPLLLGLISKILANYAQVADASTVSAQAEKLVQRLTAGGPAAIEEYLRKGGRGLDVSQPGERERAVRATIEASTSLLEDQDAKRFAELAVFARDENIPFHLVALLWQATAELDDLQAAQVSHRLAQLALVSRASGPADGIALHDVIRDFLRAELGRQRLAGLGALLLEKVAADVPAPSPPSPTAEGLKQTAWWDLDDQNQYLWNHLIEHMVDAGRPDDADAVACDLRWVAARLERFGPAAPAADLTTAGTPRATRLLRVFTRTAHLLRPTEPAWAVVDILHSRVADDPDWGLQVTALGASRHRPRLVNRWPLPDPADPELRRVLTGHTEGVSAVAVAPDSSWLASSSDDGTVRIWDPASGRERAVLTGHFGLVTAVAVAPDGSWLASSGGDEDGTVRIWDAPSGRERAVLVGQIGGVTALAVVPDGSWLLVGSRDGTLRIWEVPPGRQRVVQERAVLTGHTGEVAAVAVAPDGSWLASGGRDGTVRIWDAASGRERAVLTGHTGEVAAVAVAPDGSWLASGSRDGTVRIWDAASGRERAVLTGHTSRPAARAVAVAPDGSWLASGGQDGTVRIWDAASGRERAVLTGHSSAVAAVAVAPDGSWLASGSRDGTMRIWDAPSGRERAVLTGHTSRPAARAVAVAPDGSWLASGGRDGTVRIWDAASGRERAVLTGHTGEVAAVAVAPDGSWLASGSRDGTVRIWDAPSGRERAVLTGHTSRPAARAVAAVAPDGSWLASGGRDGTVRIWDVASGRERAVLTGHTGEVAAVAAPPDGSWLASGSRDKTVRIWDVASGRERAVLTGHTGEVAAVAAPPDGSWLASGSRDGTVRIWDVASGRERAVLTGHTGEVAAVAVAPDGSWLASGSRDKTVRIWEIATWYVCAMMRVDNDIRACAWLSPDTLVLGGPAGLYQFGFLARTSPAAAGQ